jgi:hypothetical protein
MNPDKAQIKLAFLHDQGVQLDDMLESRESQVKELAGAISILKQARNLIFGPVLSAVAEDVKAGSLPADPLQIQSYITKQFQRLELSLENIQMNAERERFATEGRAAQLRDLVAITQKKFHDEQVSLAAYVAAAEKGAVAPDGRPTLSAAEDIARRRAEAQAAKASGEPAVAPVSVAPTKLGTKTKRKGK